MRVDLRGLITAAPLKLQMKANRAVVRIDLRGLITAAPLKRGYARSAAASAALSPRSNHRGPVEAAERSHPGQLRPRHLRGLITAAPLKPIKSQMIRRQFDISAV